MGRRLQRRDSASAYGWSHPRRVQLGLADCHARDTPSWALRRHRGVTGGHTRDTTSWGLRAVTPVTRPAASPELGLRHRLWPAGEEVCVEKVVRGERNATRSGRSRRGILRCEEERLQPCVNLRAAERVHDVGRDQPALWVRACSGAAADM
eukprot:366436-Chlamydomonas_euryale.AAC.32